MARSKRRASVGILGKTPGLFVGIALIALVVLACGIYLLAAPVEEKVLPAEPSSNTMILASEQADDALEAQGTLTSRDGTLIGVLEIEQDQADDVTVGQQVDIACPQLQITNLKATVSDVLPAVSSREKDDVIITLGDLGEEAQEGMAISGVFEPEEQEMMFAVPQSAVAQDGEIGAYVEKVNDDGTLEQIQVVCAGTTEDGRVIIQGASLSDGICIRTDLS